MDVDRKLRIGIIGTGRVARLHARAYRSIEQAEVISVADVVPNRALEFVDTQELRGAQAFEDYRQLLALDLDAVSICTPNKTHSSVSIDALRAGKHVLVEKPLSVTLREGVEMVKTAREEGRLLSVGFQPRYDPNMVVIKDIVQSGQLGDVYYVEAGGGRRRGMPSGSFVRKDVAGAGAMADIGCYSLDLVLNSLGHPRPVTVSAYTSSYFGTNSKFHPEASLFNVEDFGAALIRFENGMALNFRVSWAMHMDTLGATYFLGTDGGLKITPKGSGPWSGVWDGGVGSMKVYHDIREHHTESCIPVKGHEVDLFREKVRDFVEAVAEGRSAPIPAEQVLPNQAIIDGILRSAELKREVEVELPV